MTYRRWTFEQINERFIYDPDAGELFRRLDSGAIKELTLVRETHDRYVAAQTKFGGYSIVVTHVMFMLVERRWPLPLHKIDHRNGDVFDCRWSNLREATHRQNMMNQQDKGRWKDENIGLARGVYRQHNRYVVRLGVDGVRIDFGSYATPEEAAEVARKARADHHGEFLFEASRGTEH